VLELQSRSKTAYSNKKSLLPLVGNPRQDMPKGIAFSLKDYCELVDITGMIIRQVKAGHNKLIGLNLTIILFPAIIFWVGF
jgi:hypothetical protein